MTYAKHSLVLRSLTAGLVLAAIPVRCQVARVIVPQAKVSDKPHAKSRALAEVALGTNLTIVWDNTVSVKLKVYEEKAPPGRLGGVMVNANRFQTAILVLFPVKEEGEDLWLRVRAPDSRLGWLRSAEAELQPSGNMVFPDSVAFFVPLRPSEVPKLIDAELPSVSSFLLGRMVRTWASLQFAMLVGPEGRVEAVRLVRTSGSTQLDLVILEAAQKFQFEPPRVRSNPAVAMLMLQIDFETP